ncbi:unnamed protein product [Ranitomeya imitator]|uniref:Uncharacterized protein n=1 Tax=Ranitomeya imitator TaxID=111125 RepID=A0ABN9LJ48_9NEOB|nr:unnamed protein product [Ranitomeya imitator]
MSSNDNPLEPLMLPRLIVVMSLCCLEVPLLRSWTRYRNVLKNDSSLLNQGVHLIIIGGVLTLPARTYPGVKLSFSLSEFHEKCYNGDGITRFVDLEVIPRKYDKDQYELVQTTTSSLFVSGSERCWREDMNGGFSTTLGGQRLL